MILPIIFSRLLLPLAAAVTIPGIATAGEINWQKLDIGITAHGIFPGGDFGSYWHNAPGFGVAALYHAGGRYSFKCSGNINYFKPETGTQLGLLPSIYLINLSAGLAAELPLTPGIRPWLGFGADNYTFVFRGEAADRLSSNYIESEVGIHAAGGIYLDMYTLPLVDLSLRYGIIFSHPEPIRILRLGITAFIL